MRDAVARAVRRRFQESDGAAAVEYAVMLALIAAAIIAVTGMGESTVRLWEASVNLIREATGT